MFEKIEKLVKAVCKKHSWKYDIGMTDLVINNIEHGMSKERALATWEVDTKLNR